MKTLKILFSAFFLALSFGLSSQNDSIKADSPKNLHSYLPQKGNFAVGADATPVFNYIGNIFNGTLDNELDLSTPLIYFKYYLTDMTALRGVVGVAAGSQQTSTYVRDDAAWYSNPLSNAQVTDVKSDITNNIYVSLAWQKFIGENRLRGFYGIQVFTNYNKDKTNYSYGNPMSELNPTPSSAYGYIGDERKLTELNQRAIAIGAGGIAGFEYYLMPRLCIGGEVSLNLVYTQDLQRYSKSEKMINDIATPIDRAVSPGGHSFGVETLSFTPQTMQHVGLYLMLHF